MSILLGETWDFGGSGFDECANLAAILLYCAAKVLAFDALERKIKLLGLDLRRWPPFALGDHN